MSLKKFFAAVILGGLCSIPGYSQLSELEQYNENSIDPIPRYEHLFKRRVWRTIDLKEKQNKGFFASGGELTQFIMNAVRSGELSEIYRNDSLTSKLSKDELRQLVSEMLS